MPPVKSQESEKSKVSSLKRKRRFYISSINSLENAEKKLLTDLDRPNPKTKLKHATTNAARLPTKPEEASSNWKSLCSVIKPIHTNGRQIYLEKKKIAIVEAKQQLTKVHLPVSLPSKSDETPPEPEVWFEGVDPILLESSGASLLTAETQNNTDLQSKELTKIMALDCEMVGVGDEGIESALARVSIVNQHGHCVYDKFVDPGEKVTDYRTQFSGIRPHNLVNACSLGTVCHEVSEILRGRILVGHALKNDLDVLLLKHPKSQIRDTSKFKLFKALVNGATPSLKRLTQHFLGIEIQSGEHSSIQDAKAALRLYMMFRQRWESDLTKRKSRRTLKRENAKKKRHVRDTKAK